MSQSPPLTGIRVLEFAGLAPGPYAGMLCADYGAKVLRIDRAHPQAFTESPPPPTTDNLTRHKDSITVNTKTPAGIALIKSLIPRIDVVIDPFRPGVLEKMGLGPAELQRINRRVIVARMTGFRRDGKYKDMAGHDINYIAVSGALSMLGKAGEKPFPPANILGDFAGGGAVCFMGILLALLNRGNTGLGQVVEANMVDGSAHLTSMPRMLSKPPGHWSGARGTNLLDGGAPFYTTYETKDGGFMAVGSLEPQFYKALLKGLGIDGNDGTWPKNRDDRRTWPQQAEAFERIFKSKTRGEWEAIFDGTDACVTPVLTQRDLEGGGFDQRPIVTLKSSPGLAITEGEADGRDAATGSGIGVEGNGWNSKGLRPGEGGEEVLAQWMGWAKGRHYEIKDGGAALVDKSLRSKF